MIIMITCAGPHQSKSAAPKTDGNTQYNNGPQRGWWIKVIDNPGRPLRVHLQTRHRHLAFGLGNQLKTSRGWLPNVMIFVMRRRALENKKSWKIRLWRAGGLKMRLMAMWWWCVRAHWRLINQRDTEQRPNLQGSLGRMVYFDNYTQKTIMNK